MSGSLRGLFEKYTERARQVVVLAQEEARALSHNYIGTEHILLGLLREEAGLAARALESFEISVERVRGQVVRIVGSGDEPATGQIPFTPRAKKVLELAMRESLSLGHHYVGTEHILLGLAREHEGVALRILLDFGVDPEAIRHEVLRMLPGPEGEDKPTVMATGSSTSPQVIGRTWLGGLGVVLDDLAGEIRRELQRAPDTGDLLLVLASAPETLAGQALRQLAADLDGLPDIVERVRAQALAQDELTREIQELTEAKEQAIAKVAHLRAQERDLREQARMRAAVGPEVVQEIRRHLGISGQPDDPPQTRKPT